MMNSSENNFLSIGQFLRSKRKEKGLNQQDLAQKVGVRRQTIADLENGKNVGSYLLCSVIDTFNLRLSLEPKAFSASEAKTLNNHKKKSEPIQSATVDFDYPYDWSNTGNMPVKIFISKVLRGQRFMDIVKLCKKYGVDQIEKKIALSLYDDIRPKLTNAIKNIRQAMGA
jgi:transcriptional regulator with XRE-family HTH domain